MDDTALNVNAHFPPADDDRWRSDVEATLKGRPFDKLVRDTLEGFGVQPIYAALPEGYDPGLADHPPFIRGARAADRRRAGWDIRARHDIGDLPAVADAIQADLARGVTSIWLVPRHGDAPGLPVDRAEALDRLLGDADPTQTGVYIDPGPHGAAWLATWLAVARRRDIDPSALIGGVLSDPIGALAQGGSLPQGLDLAWDELGAAFTFTAERAPQLALLGFSGLPWHNAGADAALELAAALATLIATLRALEPHGVTPEQIAARSTLQLAVGTHMFMDIARIRAARLLWSRVLTACGAEPTAPTIHACTSPVALTRRDPWINMLRGTAGCFAAAVAGADAITVLPFDRALGTPAPLAARVASNTQVVLEAESHLARVADPAGGSWAIEHLTHQLAARAWEALQAIEAQGGIIEALTSGWLKERLDATSARRQRDIARRKRAIVGVSAYANLGEDPLKRPTPHPTPDTSSPSPATLDGADLAARLEAAVAASAAGATPAAITRALHPDAAPTRCEPLPTRRHAAAWEALRDASDAHLSATGDRPRVFLANIGAIPEHKARASFAQQLFEAGGFRAITNDGFTDADAAAAAFAASGADGAVLCGSDDAYGDHAATFAAALTGRSPAFIALAGRPGSHAEAWSDAGVTHYVHLGCDALGTLTDLQHLTGLGS